MQMHSQPVSNKVLGMVEQQKQMILHRQKLQNVKGQLDLKPPTSMPYINKAKRDFLNDRNQEDIEKQNNQLLKKITNIMKRDEKPPHGRIQRSNTAMQSISKMGVDDTSQIKSLNLAQKKQEYDKIMAENQIMMKKITNTKSTYDTMQMLKERQSVEKYIAQISEYRYKDQQGNKTFVNEDMWKFQKLKEDEKQLLYQQRNPLRSAVLDPIPRRILYQGQIMKGSSFYYVQIKIYKNEFKVTLDETSKQNNKYVVKFSEEEGNRILKDECNNNFDVLIDKISIDTQNNTATYSNFQEPEKKFFVGKTDFNQKLYEPKRDLSLQHDTNQAKQQTIKNIKNQKKNVKTTQKIKVQKQKQDDDEFDEDYDGYDDDFDQQNNQKSQKFRQSKMKKSQKQFKTEKTEEDYDDQEFSQMDEQIESNIESKNQSYIDNASKLTGIGDKTAYMLNDQKIEDEYSMDEEMQEDIE